MHLRTCNFFRNYFLLFKLIKRRSPKLGLFNSFCTQKYTNYSIKMFLRQKINIKQGKCCIKTKYLKNTFKY